MSAWKRNSRLSSHRSFLLQFCRLVGFLNSQKFHSTIHVCWKTSEITDMPQGLRMKQLSALPLCNWALNGDLLLKFNKKKSFFPLPPPSSSFWEEIHLWFGHISQGSYFYLSRTFPSQTLTGDNTSLNTWQRRWFWVQWSLLLLFF